MDSHLSYFIQSSTSLRIHISTVGFEVDRIVLPALKMKADRVWLIIHDKPYEDKGIPFLEMVKERLSEKNIEWREEAADRNDLFDVIRAFRWILIKEAGNNIMVNVSAGSKIQAIALTMGCMMFKKNLKAKAYYVVPTSYTPIPKQGDDSKYNSYPEQETEGMEDIIALPDYEIEIPNQKLIKCMALIDRQENGTVTKKRLRDLALTEGLIHIEGGRDEKAIELAAYMALNKNLILPLLNRNYISVERTGGSHRITLTSDGKNILKFMADH
jgi:uncharacterized protein DUF6293